jgi:hypothetical protein
MSQNPNKKGGDHMKYAITLAAFCILSGCGDKEDSAGDTGEVVSEETD